MTLENAQAPEGGDGVWLPLVEYSLKSGVSMSTIRRKIKTNAIPFRLEKGKYLILFSGDTVETLAPTPTRAATAPIYAPKTRPVTQFAFTPPPPRFAAPKATEAAPTPFYSPPTVSFGPDENAQIPLIDRTVRMVSEAFESALKQKDEHIRLLEIRSNDLKERVNELQLLVKVLEEKYAIEY